MRKITGTLVAKPSGFFCRVWVPLPDGSKVREWRSLDTKDRNTAKRRLARLIADVEAGKEVAEAHAAAIASETYRSYTLARHEQRHAAGVTMARDEQRNRTAYIYPTIGTLPLVRVTDDHVRQILEGARDKGLARETVHKIRAVLRRDFKRAKKEKLVDASPAEDADLPEGLKVDKRPFESLTDAEVGKFLAAPKGDLELKMVSIVARTEGGMRTAELVRWTWQMIDLVDFAACTVARAKTGEVQRLEVPDVLRPFLHAWWDRGGKPVAGPVFPVRRGRRVGEAKQSRGTSFAARLRRDLFRAGVVRVPPVVVEGKPAPNPADPIYSDTPVSRRVTFHSFRRAYDRALARAGVNMQTAMTLSAHSDERVHMRYVRELEAAQPVPANALPVLDPGLALRLLAPRRPIRPMVKPESPAVETESPAGDNSGRSTSNHPGNDNLDARHPDSRNAASCLTLGTSALAWEADALPTELVPRRGEGLAHPAGCGSPLSPSCEAMGTAGDNSARRTVAQVAAEGVRAMMAVREAFASAGG